MATYLPANPDIDPNNKSLLYLTIRKLLNRGHKVEICADIPGLFRVDGGPEMTVNQFLSVGAKSDELIARGFKP